jgi:hypothetical protein
MREYLWQTRIRTGLAVLPFAFGCYVTERFWRARMASLFAQIAVVLPLFAVGLATAYWKELKVLKGRVNC